MPQVEDDVDVVVDDVVVVDVVDVEVKSSFPPPQPLSKPHATRICNDVDLVMLDTKWLHQPGLWVFSWSERACTAPMTKPNTAKEERHADK
jgi:hypothetical protein